MSEILITAFGSFRSWNSCENLNPKKRVAPFVYLDIVLDGVIDLAEDKFSRQELIVFPTFLHQIALQKNMTGTRLCLCYLPYYAFFMASWDLSSLPHFWHDNSLLILLPV